MVCLSSFTLLLRRWFVLLTFLNFFLWGQSLQELLPGGVGVSNAGTSCSITVEQVAATVEAVAGDTASAPTTDGILVAAVAGGIVSAPTTDGKLVAVVVGDTASAPTTDGLLVAAIAGGIASAPMIDVLLVTVVAGGAVASVISTASTLCLFGFVAPHPDSLKASRFSWKNKH